MSGALARRGARARSDREQMARERPSLASRLGLDSGVHRLLETPLVINGAEGSTILRFVPSQATATGLAEYGGAGTWTWSSSPTLAQQTPYLGSLDGAVRSTGQYGVASAPWFNFGTQDIVVEALVVLDNPSAAEMVFSSYVAPDVCYFQLYSNAGGLVFSINGTTGLTAPTNGITARAVSLLHGIYDQSEQAAIYNGSAGSVAPSVSGSLDITRNPALFARPNGGLPTTGCNLLWLAFHSRASWLDTYAQTTLVAQRRALLTASRPSFSVVPSTYPSAAGSTSPVYQQRRLASGADQLFYMGQGSPTFDRIVDAAGRAVVGHLVEIASKNVLLQSQTLGTTWAKLDAGDTIGANAALGPDGTASLESIIADGTDGLHGVSQASSENLTAAKWVLSGYHRIGTKGWVYVDNTTVANCTAYFSTAGVVGTLGAGVLEAGCEVVGTDFIRWRIAFTGTVALHTCRVAVADADGDNSVAGDGAEVQGYAGCILLSAGDYPSSYVITTTAAVTRAASSLKYALTNCLPRSEGSLVGAILCRSFTPTRARVIFSLDDGSANNRIELFTTATTGLLSALSRKAAGTDGDVELTAHGSVFDNKIRPFMLTWNAAELALWVRDPTTRAWTVARDATLTPIAGATLTTLCVGHDNAIANHAGPGAYPLSDWAVMPKHYDHPSEVRRGDSLLWESY